MSKYQNLIGGAKIPTVGLGTWNATDEVQLESALDAALENGYRHIDTAFVYRNEAVIGRVLKKWLSSGKLKREELFITTKLPSEGLFADQVEKYFNESLTSLQLDYVDLYLIHGPVAMIERKDGGKDTAPTDHLAVWKKFEALVDAGKIKSIGVSNFNSRQIERIWQNSRIKPVCNQVELSPFLQQPELVKYCHSKGIVVVGYSSLGSPGRGAGRKDKSGGAPIIPNVLGNDTILKIAQKHNRSPAQVVLRFFVQKNIIMIPKSVTPSRLKENFDLFSFVLDTDDVSSIEKLDKGEAGRSMDPARRFPKIKEHPEYAFK